MNEFERLFSNIIDQLPSIIDSLSEEEFNIVQQTLSLARKQFTESKIDQSQKIPKGAEFLYVLSGGNPKIFADYARQFPDASLNKMARNKQALNLVLDKLAKTIKISRGSEEGIKQAPLQSSTVYGSKYDPKNKNLYVKFQGDGVYKYDNVPKEIAFIFQNGMASAKTNGRNKYGTWFKNKNPSLGAALNQYIKYLGFPYQKIS